MKLGSKLTIFFLVLSIGPTVIVGLFGYESGRRTIIEGTVDHLISINTFKSQELQRWVEENKSSIEELAQRPLVRHCAEALVSHEAPDPAYQTAHDSILADHLNPRLKYGGFFELFVMCPRHGHISASTDERQEGKYRDALPYYVEGKNRTHVQGAYYSPALEQPAMTISTPIRNRQGSLVGVLGGRLDLGELSRIITLQTGKSRIEDTYLVNTFNFFVTEPRFGEDYALRKAVRTEGVEAGLSGMDGVGFYKNYRGWPVIGAYKWLPAFNMCIITEMEEAEAFAPVVRLGWVIAVIACVIAIGAGLLGLLFTRTITRPVWQLVAGTEDIGAGNLECRVGTASEDEIGVLSRAFDRMAEKLKATMVSRDELSKSEERERHLNAVLRAVRDVNQLITKEKDPNRLIQRACENLVETRGFKSAWIAIMDESGGLVRAVEAGLGERFVRLRERLENGELPSCAGKVLTQTGVVTIRDVLTECPNCPLASSYEDHAALCTALQHQGKTYGILSASISSGFALDQEEQGIFLEMGEDIAFALHNAEVEESRRQTEDERNKIRAQLLQAQKLEMVGRLTGGIAHDFNNLLTPIIGNAEMALSDMSKEDPLYEDMQEIRSAGARAASLIRQLLAFSRKQILQPEILDLNGVLLDMEKMLRRIIGEDIQLETVLSPDLGLVEADVGQMEQVLMNLVVNARDAMPRGGKLTIETGNVDLDEAYSRNHISVIPGPYVLLAVSDTGAGMSKEVQEHLFEPFFTTKEKGKGTGLGLSTVYGIVKQSKGNIWVYSEPGKGSCFKIYLPRVEKKAPVIAEAEKEEKSLQGSGTILVVEDDEMVRNMALKILQRHGYTVLCAGDSQEAIHMCREYKEQIRLVLTDVVMPGMSGRDLAEELQRLRPGMKVLFMSGYTDNAIVHHGVLDKGVAFLQKPFTPEGLARKVKEVLAD